MGVRVEVEASGRTYTVVEDVTSVFGVLVTGTATDDVTGTAPRTALELRTDREGVFAKALESGAFCLAGELERVLPGHATTPHSFALRIRAAGYVAQTVTVSAPAASAIPIVLAPVALRPLPIRVQGRVVQSSTDRSPAPGAIVRVADDGAQGRLSLRTPLHADHALGAPVQARAAAPVGAQRTLTRDAAGGADILALSGAPVTGTPVLGLEPQRRLEFVPVAMTGPAPREITLTQRLTRSYPAGTPVAEFAFTTPTPTPPMRQLTRGARAGDGLLLLNGSVATAATAVQVGDAAAGPIELHSVGAVADPQGFYALDGVGGVATITLRARPTPGGAAGPVVPWTLDAGRSPNLVNLQLAP